MISKSEFARRAGVSPAYLFRTIHENISLMVKLEEEGHYARRAKMLSDVQAQIICGHLGIVLKPKDYARRKQ